MRARTGNVKTGILISIIIVGALVTAGIFAWAALRVATSDPVIGKWLCTSMDNGLVVELDLNEDGSYLYGDPHNLANNYLRGDEYQIINKGDNRYLIRFSPTKKIFVKGVEEDPTYYEFGDIGVKVINSLFSRKTIMVLKDMLTSRQMGFECKIK